MRGTPGPYACAAVLRVDGRRPESRTRYLGDEGTNNRAEFGGLLLALEMALEAGVTHLTIRSDSKLVVEQVLGNWRVREPSLLPLRDRARELASRLQDVRIDHVPREENLDADALCTAELDLRTGRARR